MRPTLTLFGTGLLALLFSCTTPSTTDSDDADLPGYPKSLPMDKIGLEDLQAFRPTGANWQIAGNAFSAYQTEGSLETEAGTGVLVNQMTETAKEQIFTKMEHGDIDLEVDFLMPKGANSGIYFQGRYEIQLFDSWGVDPPRHSDCGGIYQRWDTSRPKGQEGYEGHAPRVNASKAPGLWQHFRISFQAPRFDAAGNKTENARFREVWLNGMLIHENVEVLGPTRSAAFEDEAPLGPLMIQGDHKNVALRNIQYKAYGSDSLRLSNIQYQLYQGGSDHIPNFDTLTLVQEGDAASLDVAAVQGDLKDHFAIRFSATLHVPVSGNYLFKTGIDDGGDLSIDGKLVVHNEADPGYNEAAAIVALDKGEHPFELTFYQEVWSAQIRVFYEGPGIEYRQLAFAPKPPKQQRPPKPPVLVQPGTEAEMVRGFVMYGDKKRTHTVSVGDPAGVHYSYDLREGALLKSWKGGFGDVTSMWQDRGNDQLLQPLNASIELNDGSPVASLTNEKAPWPTTDPEHSGFKGYQIGAGGRPTFRYEKGVVSITDKVAPAAAGSQLSRTLTVQSPKTQRGYWCRIASAPRIELLPNGLYRIDGSYYLDLQAGDAAPLLREINGVQELLIPVLTSSTQSQINYSLLW